MLWFLSLSETSKTFKQIIKRKGTIEIVKEELMEIEKEIIGYITNNIKKQNQDESLLALMNGFGLNYDEDLDICVEKISNLYDSYQVNNENKKSPGMRNDCQVVIADKRMLHCTKDELLKQFNKSLVKINKLSQALHEAKDKQNTILSKLYSMTNDLLKKFVLSIKIQFRNVCKLTTVMIYTTIYYIFPLFIPYDLLQMSLS